MSSNLLIFIEVSLVFLVVFGWGFNELRQLKAYKKKSSNSPSEKFADNK